MKIEDIDIFKDRFCNECSSQNNVKEVHVGANVIALCESCRKKLCKMLYYDCCGLLKNNADKNGIKICEITNVPCSHCKPVCNDWIYKKEE